MSISCLFCYVDKIAQNQKIKKQIFKGFTFVFQGYK